MESRQLRTYYDVLGVAPDAPSEVVQAAYRALTKKYHPDTGWNSDVEMKLINEAYSILNDPKQRMEYDTQIRQTAASQLPSSDEVLWSGGNVMVYPNRIIVGSGLIPASRIEGVMVGEAKNSAPMRTYVFFGIWTLFALIGLGEMFQGPLGGLITAIFWGIPAYYEFRVIRRQSSRTPYVGIQLASGPVTITADTMATAQELSNVIGNVISQTV